MASIVFLASLALAVHAQVPVWGQCGGLQFKGQTVCATGAYCTSQNPWFYQCLPGTSTPAATTATSSIAASTTASRSIGTTLTSVRTSSPSVKTVSSTKTAVTYPTPTKYFITFGDSYSQTGFDINGTKPSAANPLGNPDLPGWTASGGLDWVGFMVTEFNNSLTLSYNLAYGGATTDADLVTPYASTVLSFEDQVTEFNRSLASKPTWAPWNAHNTLVGVWMGVNDVGNTFWLSDASTIITNVLTRYFELLQVVYDAGVRNFALLSVPPTEKTPLMLANGAESNAQLASVIKLYNDLLASNLATFKAHNAGVTAWIVDTSVPFNTAINNPTAYGAPNATCYNEDGVSCLWFNDYHPGIQIQKLVAAAVAKTVGPAWFSS